jgi:hypothetical protein
MKDRKRGDADKTDKSPGDALLAAILVGLTAAGLAVATGKIVPFPEEVAIPPYILLYSFLGSLAYLLTSTITEYEKLKRSEDYKSIEKELATRKVEKKELEKRTEAGEMALPKNLMAQLEKVKENLDELDRKRSELMEFWKKVELKIWIKVARIPFGMVMAVAFYLLIPVFISEDLLDVEDPRLLAGIAFVVALFPKVMIKGFSGLASRLIGTSDNEDSGELT